MKPLPFHAARAVPLTLLAVALLGSYGCGWLRGQIGYELSPEARPLAIPPDLDTPASDPSLAIPEVATPAAAPSAAAVAASSAPFVVTDETESVWRRVGFALERIDGATITDRAQLLSAYGVRFDGEDFLIRITSEGGASRVSAATIDGRETSSAAATRLLGLLRQRLS